jgi:hypothetical protein
MKKREEVEKHLKSTGYSKHAVNRILAFLVGAGVKEFDEQMIVKYGDGTWEDFYEWWNNEDECNDCVFCNLMNYLCKQHNKSTNEDEKEKISRYIEFLIDAFGDDEEIEVEVEITDED